MLVTFCLPILFYEILDVTKHFLVPAEHFERDVIFNLIFRDPDF